MLRYRLRNDSMLPGRLLFLVYRNSPQQPEIAEHAARPNHHGSQRIVGDGHRQASLLPDALIQVLEHGSATGEDDAAVADVRAQLGWGALQRLADGVDDGSHALPKRLADLGVVYGDGAGHALDEVAPLDLHGEGLVERVGRADFDLDGLRGTLAAAEVVFALEELHDGFVHLVAGHAHGARVDDAGERDDGHVGGAAADIHHHVAERLRDGQPGADGDRKSVLQG